MSFRRYSTIASILPPRWCLVYCCGAILPQRCAELTETLPIYYCSVDFIVALCWSCRDYAKFIAVAMLVLLPLCRRLRLSRGFWFYYFGSVNFAPLYRQIRYRTCYCEDFNCVARCRTDFLWRRCYFCCDGSDFGSAFTAPSPVSLSWAAWLCCRDIDGLDGARIWFAVQRCRWSFIHSHRLNLATLSVSISSYRHAFIWYRW